ncbi:hypothetical protein [Ruegeria faecimaris]|uniref:hypothetical protein n=1 Tax=Ruegeria faecimaris TaxID=686389 RepID=UPI00249279F0|nr:hypothetical protein [Ruegeria faecimaris]
MTSFRLAKLAILCLGIPTMSPAQSAEDPSAGLLMELNNLQQVDGNCRLSFLVQNQTGAEIEAANYETVIFNAEGNVVSLTLYKFRDIPAGRLRVRQFSIADMSCGDVGRILINGSNTCTVEGAESDLCDAALTLNNRTDVEFLR